MFENIDFWAQTVDEKIKEKKQKDKPLFDTEIIKINNYEIKSYERIKKISEITSPPSQKEHIRIVTHNSFNSFDILEWFCYNFNSFEEVYISSYNFGEKTIESIFELKNKNVFNKLSLIISESIRFRKPKIFKKLKEYTEKAKNTRLAGIWNHSKIMLLKKGSDFFVVEGSGNFNSNAYIEQYSIDNNEDLFNFHKNWMESYVFNVDNIQKKRHFVI